MYITNSTKNVLDAVYSLSLHISYMIKHFIVIDKQRARLASDAFTVKDIEKS